MTKPTYVRRSHYNQSKRLSGKQHKAWTWIVTATAYVGTQNYVHKLFQAFGAIPGNVHFTGVDCHCVIRSNSPTGVGTYVCTYICTYACTHVHSEKQLPRAISSSLAWRMASRFSLLSLEALNRRDLCWFILARGAYIAQWQRVETQLSHTSTVTVALQNTQAIFCRWAYLL